MPFPLCHPGRTFVIFQNLLLSFFLPLFFSKTCVRSSGLQLLGHPIQSGRTESAFRETSCCPICWKAKSHRLFKFKNGTNNNNSNTEKSISTLWRNPTYCERKEDSLGLIIFFSECRMFPFFLLVLFVITVGFPECFWVLSVTNNLKSSYRAKLYYFPLQVRAPRRTGYLTPRGYYDNRVLPIRNNVEKW